jgi:hypothetical protein
LSGTIREIDLQIAQVRNLANQANLARREIQARVADALACERAAQAGLQQIHGFIQNELAAEGRNDSLLTRKDSEAVLAGGNNPTRADLRRQSIRAGGHAWVDPPSELTDMPGPGVGAATGIGPSKQSADSATTAALLYCERWREQPVADYLELRSQARRSRPATAIHTDPISNSAATTTNGLQQQQQELGQAGEQASR